MKVWEVTLGPENSKRRKRIVVEAEDSLQAMRKARMEVWREWKVCEVQEEKPK